MEAHSAPRSTAQNQRYYDYDYDNFAKKNIDKGKQTWASSRENIETKF